MSVVTAGHSELLAEARERTLALVERLSDADVEAAHSTLMSPLVWDLAHIAAYEDLWLVHRHGGQPLLAPDHAAMYDAFETPRDVRGDLPLLDRAQALGYLESVRERVHAVLAERGPATASSSSWSSATSSSTARRCCRRSSAPGSSPLPALDAAPRPAAPGGHTGLEAVEVPAGRCTLGAGRHGFAYDNERPRHAVEVPAFRIGRTPVTNATWLTFAEGGGYERREWWSDEGWAWKEDYDITHPEGWARGPRGWQRWRLDGWAPLDPDEPVVHVSWFEADAFARANGARLPTEAEWEKAATWDQDTGSARTYPWGDEPPSRERANLDQAASGPLPAGALPAGASPYGVLGMTGDVWEWTSSDFGGYPGFVAHPYREYSEVFFGRGYKVLRGSAWATRPRVATAAMRNWDLPLRRQIFSGVRLAWD